jgi:exonuclease VII large subunit
MKPMRNFLLGFLFVATLLIPTAVFAQNTAGQPKEYIRTETQERLQENQPDIDAKRNTIRETIRTRIETKKATIAARLTARKQARVQSRWRKLNVRLGAVISRLEKLIGRIESRVAKISASGEEIDTTNVEAQLAEARAILEQAEVDLEAANSLLAEVLASDNPSLSFTVIKDTVKEIRGEIIEAHKMLVLTLREIRGLRVGVN